MPDATLTISSRNYSSWSLRGWLLCRMAELDFEERIVPLDDPSARAELLLLSPSVLVPRLTHGRIIVWDTLAIAEHLNEAQPQANLWPVDPVARAHARAVSGEMHSGFANLRSALPMNLKAHYPGFTIWAGAQGDIDRVIAIWRNCLAAYGGPYLFGSLSAADAMYAPVCTRFLTYDVRLDSDCADYCAGSWNGQPWPSGSQRRERSLRRSRSLTWSSRASPIGKPIPLRRRQGRGHLDEVRTSGWMGGPAEKGWAVSIKALRPV